MTREEMAIELFKIIEFWYGDSPNSQRVMAAVRNILDAEYTRLEPLDDVARKVSVEDIEAILWDYDSYGKSSQTIWNLIYGQSKD